MKQQPESNEASVGRSDNDDAGGGLRASEGSSIDNRARALLDRFESQRGFTREWHRHLVHFDPDFFERYTELSSHMYKRGALPMHVKELILMAIDVACTHQHGAGTKVHMQNALRHGASVDEIVETLELCTLIGIHSCTLGLPILAEVLADADPNGANVMSQREK